MDCFVLWVCNRGCIVLIHLVSVDSSSIAAYLSLSQMLVIIAASLVIISSFLLLSFKVSFLNELLYSPFTNVYFRVWKKGRETERSASIQKVFMCTEGMNSGSCSMIHVIESSLVLLSSHLATSWRAGGEKLVTNMLSYHMLPSISLKEKKTRKALTQNYKIHCQA